MTIVSHRILFILPFPRLIEALRALIVGCDAGYGDKTSSVESMYFF